MRSTGAMSMAAWPRASVWQWLHATNVWLCLGGAADERLWHFHSCSYLVFCHCHTSLSTWNMCSKLLQPQIHHKHLVVRTLLVSWLCWTNLPGESWVWGFHKCCSWDFLVEFPISLGGMLHRCFWLTFLFKTARFLWTLYCSLCSEKNPNFCWSVWWTLGQSLLDCPTGVGKALYCSLGDTLQWVSGVAFEKSSFWDVNGHNT